MTDHDPHARPTRRPIVLAVDDVRTNLLIASTLLEELKVDIRLADNGPQALAEAWREPYPDLILLDVMMPDMDGHDVLARLQGDPRSQKIPVIFVTALDSPGEEQFGLQEGAVDYIAKPLKPEVFRARVLNQLSLKQARDDLALKNARLEEEIERRVTENTRLASRLQMSLSASGLGIWEYHHHSDSMIWNHDLRLMLGRNAAPANLADTLALVHPEEQAHLEHAIRQSTLPDAPNAIEEFRIQHADGHWLWVELRCKCSERDIQGAPRLTTGTLADISRRKWVETEQRLAAAVLDGINEGVAITDPDSTIRMVNRSFTRVTGYTAEEAVGRKPNLLKSGVHGQPFYRALWDLLEKTGNWQGEITNRRKNGELVIEWLSISAVRDTSGKLTHYVAVFSDLSEREAAAERIAYLTSYDPLTDLPNRSLFTDRLTQTLMNATRFEQQTAIILLDLDRFRTINETLGPPLGDEILNEMARRLKLQVRDGDTIGRRSGNEFGFVMANLGHERDAIALAQRMLAVVSEPFTVGGHTVAITASIGISLAPRDGQTTDELLMTADSALSRAKQAGRNTFRFYSPEMDANAARRLGLEAALHDALARGELSLVYQPQVSLESGNVIGVEALLRWTNPEFGVVSPAEFIPLAEDNGLIMPIGEWVLTTACQQARRWLDLGFASQMRLAVNLSNRQFLQADLVQQVSRALNNSGLPANALELDITEGAFTHSQQAEQAIATCRALKKLGVRLSLDDFGTGYSSLAHMSRFPFDKIKIDQSFVHDIIENPVNAAIATSAIVMARSLNLSVLAEGVETDAQARFLRGRRCDAMQGYLFSHPLPADQLEQMLAGRKRLPMPELPSDNEQTLLIVDDEQNVLSALTRLLRREGYRVLTTTSPQEAFEHLAKQPVQVILSDQRMPEMSGTEFLARVKQLYPDTIRIVLTGYTDLDSITNAINRGAIYRFLTKPWDDDQLREQIREAFRLAKENQLLRIERGAQA